jgi:hypothetical protein
MTPSALDAIDVAEPCTQSWEAMTGDDRSRFCGSCRLHVYDLSAMTRSEAEELVRSRKGAGERLCVRFFRRADGTVMTDDCGPIRRRARRVRAAVVAALLLLFPATASAFLLPAARASSPRVPAHAPKPPAPPAPAETPAADVAPAPPPAPEPPVQAVPAQPAPAPVVPAPAAPCEQAPAPTTPSPPPPPPAPKPAPTEWVGKI